MKKYTLLVFSFFLCGPVLAQWNISGSNVYYNGGNVGIGTSSPSNAQGWNTVLDVNGAYHAKILATANDGSVKAGIFAHNPSWYGGGGFIGTESNHNLFFLTNYNAKMMISTSGKVGIGTMTPGEMLDVNGRILSRMTNPGGWDVALGVSSGNGLLVGTINGNTNTASDKAHILYRNTNGGIYYGYNNTGSVTTQINSQSGGATYFNSGGHVGIGTTSPIGRLDINHAGGQLSLSGGTVVGGVWTNAADKLYLADWDTGTKGLNINLTNGNIGIGSPNPIYKLEVNSSGASNLRLVSNGSTTPNPSIDIFDSTNGTEFVLSPSVGKVDLFTYSNHALAFGTANSEKMRIGSNGNVSIGTTDPGSFKLAVNGKVWAQEVQVALTNPGPDYVFEPAYKLLSLEEIKNYIDQHKHLPEVPSAKEMETNGVNVSEMNMLLLRKIEELTLHLIEQNKIIAQLQEEHRVSPDTSGKQIDELTLHIINQEQKLEKMQQEILDLKNK